MLWVAFIKFDRLHQAKDYETVMGEHADVAIVIEKDAAILELHFEEIAAKEHGLVRTAQHPEESRGDVKRTAELAVLRWGFDGGGTEDDERDLIGMDGNTLLAIDPRAVVGDDSKNGIGPERFFFGGVEKAAEAIIGIFYGVFTPLLFRVFGNPAFGIRVRFMV